jgi:hypothetical protein
MRVHSRLAETKKIIKKSEKNMVNINEMKNIDVQNYISRKCSIEDIKTIIQNAEFMLNQKRGRLFSKFRVGDKVSFMNKNEKFEGIVKKMTKKKIIVNIKEGYDFGIYPEHLTNTVDHSDERIYEYMKH